MSASLAVQRLLVAALTADPALAALTGVFDGVPVEAAPPYLTLGPDIVSDWSHQTGIGHEHRVSLAVWDEPGGTARVKTLAAAAEARVRGLAGTDGGHRVAGVAFVRSFVLKDPDGWTQGVVEFRIRTEQL